MKMLFYTNFKFLLCLLFTLCLQNVNAQAQSLNASGSSTLTDESKEQIYAEQKNLEQKVNLLLTSIRQRLAVPQVSERFETVLSEQIYAKANAKCPSIPLKRLFSSNNRFAFNEGMVREEVYYLAELLQSLNVLINQ
jgi:hypothetical protein